MTTSQHSQLNLESLTSLLEDSPAKTYQLPDKARASRKLQGLVSGSNSLEPYAWYDQNTSSWKTYQRSLLTDWTLFSETFTRQGIMNVSGAVYQAQVLELAINVTDGSYLESLPTPTTMDHLGQRSPEALRKQMEGARKGRTKLANLREAVNPKTQETFNSLLPTPRAAKGMNMKLSKGMAKLEHKKYLETEIAAKIHTHGEVQNTDSTQTGDNMYLNPAFVEEMMGYEIGWTDLKH